MGAILLRLVGSGPVGMSSGLPGGVHRMSTDRAVHEPPGKPRGRGCLPIKGQEEIR